MYQPTPLYILGGLNWGRGAMGGGRKGWEDLALSCLVQRTHDFPVDIIRDQFHRAAKQIIFLNMFLLSNNRQDTSHIGYMYGILAGNPYLVSMILLCWNSFCALSSPMKLGRILKITHRYCHGSLCFCCGALCKCPLQNGMFLKACIMCFWKLKKVWWLWVIQTQIHSAKISLLCFQNTDRCQLNQNSITSSPWKKKSRREKLIDLDILKLNTTRHQTIPLSFIKSTVIINHRHSDEDV